MDTRTHNAISSEILALMGRRKVSQTRLAQAIGVSQAKVSRRLDPGGRPWDLDELDRICRFFNISIADLIRQADAAVAAGLARENSTNIGDYPWDSALGGDGAPHLRPVVGTVLADLLTDDGTEFGQGFGPGSMN